MTVVVDVGCAIHDPTVPESVVSLIEKFRPVALYGFDPLMTVDVEKSEHDGTKVELYQMAAWTHTGSVGFDRNGISSHVNDGGVPVPCVDFAKWLNNSAKKWDDEIIVKLDIEGGEYALLDALEAADADRHVDLFLIEWHSGPRPVRRPVQDWWL